MATFEENSWVWVPDDEEQALPAKVLGTFRPGDEGRVLTEDGEEMTIPADKSDKLIVCDPEVLNSQIDNLIALNDLNENAILHNLRIRFKQDIIYTNVSSILISVNPFKLLPLYTPEMMDRYRENARDLPPHVFKVADFAYRGMLSERKDQAIVISGESGAGKSEATKLMLQYVADVSSRSAGAPRRNADAAAAADEEGADKGSLEQQILQANPIMEAFGNAKTVRNNNSSRFGKLITVKFDVNGGICGGSIINYLLEKSRVVFQSQGERNYHIFYQLVAGGKAEPTLQTTTQTTDNEDYSYLSQSGVTVVDGMNDEKEFSIVRRGFVTLGMDETTEVLEVLKVVASVLHLGNIEFAKVERAMEEDSCAVANMPVLELVAALLGLDPVELNKNLTSKNIGTRSIILTFFTAETAQETRDALVKSIYGALFQFIIDRINKSLQESQTSATFSNIIGVLDIFGFESFEKNYFEQLCINYCNEKLQFHFNEHIFRLEQEVYEAEGVDVPRTDFADNQPTLNLIEEKGNGILPMADEEINVPRGSDQTLLSKLQNKHGKHPNFKSRPPSKLKVPNSQNCFGVVHYAGEVYYDITKFLEKNKDSLSDDLKGMLKKSDNAFVAQLVKEPEADADAAKTKVRARGGGKKKGGSKTLAAQFKASLASLMTTLNAAEPHFVRCMKPNKAKVGGVCEAEMILAQLRYSGLLEVCRIRKLGYPVRRDNADFLSRYAIVAGAAPDLPSLITALQGDGKLTEGQFALGSSKVFMKNKQAQDLEIFRDEAVLKSVLKMQSLVRGAVFKFKFKRCLKTLRDLQAAIDARDEDALTAAIDMLVELPHGGKHLPQYQAGQTLLVRLTEERQLVGLLEAALSDRNKESLKSGIAAAAGMTPPFEHALLGEAAEMVTVLEKEEAVINGLKKAMLARDRAALGDLLREADELDINSDEVRQAVALQARLEEEEATLDSLRDAIADRNMNNLQAFLSKCSEMGLNAPEVDEAKRLLTQLQAEGQAKLGLKDAIDQRDLDVLVAAIAKAGAVGLAADCVELAEANALKATIDNEKAALAKLAAATEAKDKAAIDAGIAECTGLGLADAPQIADAEQMKTLLAAEEACEAALTAALDTNTLDALSAALAEAGRLGLTGAGVVAVRTRMDELSAAAEGAGKLAAVQASDSIAEIEAALTEADGVGGLANDPAYKAAKVRLAQLEEEQAFVAELVAATAGNDSKVLSQCVVKGMKLGIQNKYAAEFKAAKDKASAMGEASKVETALAQAVKSRDLDALDAAIARAAELNLDNEEVNKAKEAKVGLEAEAAIEAEIAAALENVKDAGEGPLREAYDKAKAANIETDVVLQARVVLDRKIIVEETYSQIDEATESKDLNLLQKALETGIQLGLTGDKIDAAGQLRETLQTVVDELAKVKAAMTVLNQKMTSTGGIRPDDVATLAGVIETAESSGNLAAELMSAGVTAELNEAKARLARGQQQIAVQQQLQAAIASPTDHAALKAALAEANNLDGLRLAALDKVRELFKVADEKFQKDREGEEDPIGEDEELDPDDARKRTEERYEHAKQARFKFTVYPGLRSADDYAKTVILQKRKIKDGMLKWSNQIILKSLLDLDAESSKMAVQIHRSLLGYMGDKAMSFPATLAQDILQKGLQSIRLRNEIYMQVMKQLTTNPTADSIAKGWQIMCMCVSTFPCSGDFEDYLLNFMLTQREKKGAVKNYAKYCLRTLAGMLQTGTSGLFVPSVEEIQAYKERPPILATVEIVDGHYLTEELPVTPDLNVGKVVEICTHFLELSDERAETMGIFVYDLPRDESIPDPDAEKPYASLERTPRPLKNDDFMGDVIVQKARQKRNYKFVFKRKIFLPSQNVRSEDSMFNRLQFLQAEDEVITQGNLVVTDEEKAIQLASLSYRIDMGQDFPEDVETMASDSEFNVVDYIPVSWREAYSAEEWAQRVLANRESLLEVDTVECQQQFVEMIWDHELYGGHFFNVVVLACSLEMPAMLKIAFNYQGMWIFDQDMHLEYAFGFADIYRWGGSSSQFSLIIWNTKTETTFELKLATAQAADMAGIILDYINAIMASQQK